MCWKRARWISLWTVCRCLVLFRFFWPSQGFDTLNVFLCVASSSAHTLGLFNHNYWRKCGNVWISDWKHCHLLSHEDAVFGVSDLWKWTFKVDWLLKLFEDDEKATSSRNTRANVTGRAGQSQRDNKKTVGLQVRAQRAGNCTFGGVGEISLWNFP